MTNYEWLVTNGKLADFLKIITEKFYSDKKKNVFEKAAEYLQKPYTSGKDVENDA